MSHHASYLVFLLALKTPACFTHHPKPRSHPSDPSTKEQAFLTIRWGTPLPLFNQGESSLVASSHRTVTLWPFLLPMGSTTRRVWAGWPLGCINHCMNVMGCSQAWHDGEDAVHVSASQSTTKKWFFSPLLSREKYRGGGRTSSAGELPSESLCLILDLGVTLSKIISVTLAYCFHWHMVLFYIDIFCKATLDMLCWA